MFRVQALVLIALVFLVGGLASANEHLVPNEQGALSGKNLVFSPGHGYQRLNGVWRWQRPFLNEIREDIHTNEIFIEVIQRYLAGAGLRVESCRERSFQTEEVVVDDRSAGYSETGAWSDSTVVPAHYGNRYRFAASAPQETATAEFTPTIPADGVYPVYVWFTHGGNRAVDALYRVHHAGGVSEVRLTQAVMGNHWRFLGEWGFSAGTSGKVVVSNQGSDTTKFVIADAVRFGGGVGASGQARYREGAKDFLAHKGYTSGRGEVTIRPEYATWLAGGDVTRWRSDFAYVSLHTNAGGGTGTSSFSFGNGRNGVGPSGYHTSNPTPLTAASDRLRDLLNAEIVRAVRGEFDPSWSDRRTNLANFGELRECRNMPSTLVELAFHDSASDSARLRDGAFRHATGRAIYKAILRSFDANATVSPLPPSALRIENAGAGELRVSWEAVLDSLEPGAAPTGYRVYLSPNGFAFDDGVAVSGTQHVLTGLTPGQRVFVKVTGTNAGGEGLATPVGGAIVGEENGSRVLLVDGFTRSYRFTSTNWAKRYTYDYSREHVSALAATLPSHVGLDYAQDSGVGGSGVDLTAYGFVDWLLGRQGSVDGTLDANEQQLLSNYLVGGGRLLVSGTELGYDLGGQGGGALFLEAQLGAQYVRDDAGVSLARPTPGGPFAGLGNLDFSQGRYVASSPDVLRPSPGAEALLSYETSGAPGAATGIRNRVLTLGFPIESIGLAQRTQLLQSTLGYLDPDLPAPLLKTPPIATAPVSSTTAPGSTG
ncbi:MAG: N-acetylmuramoyl-L-alanine amidase, partial [Planctomycetes bacterium]|nr:N-acetylmuramoyl-L-alanine amidase [Planctomycetota bacterium]